MKLIVAFSLCAMALAFPAPQQMAQTEGAAPAVFVAEMATGSPSGSVTIEVHRDWAPRGADRFYQLIKSGFFNNARVFRVVPGFVVQWGINGDPAVQKMYRGGSANIMDDPVKQSNKRGTVSFATSGPNTRSTQLFINLNDNANLDGMGFAPIGKVVKGMDQVAKMYSGYGETPDQGAIQMQGNAYLQKNFPQLTYFSATRIVSQGAADTPWNN